MEFEIQRTEFLEGLRLTQGVVERRNTLPILSNTLIEPIEGRGWGDELLVYAQRRA